MKKIIIAVAAFLTIAVSAAFAGNGNSYSRDRGIIARAGIGSPAGFELGAGYQFGPHFSLTAETFSFSGLTSMSGIADARYYIFDSTVTPFVDARLGYGVLGKNLENKSATGLVSVASAGIGWRGFDLSGGFIYDNFHKAGLTANLSWTIRF